MIVTHSSFTPYKKRPARYQGMLHFQQWQLKQYSISVNHQEVSPALIEAAGNVVQELVSRHAVTESRYGIGFMILHQGADGNYILVSWWEGQNMLCHHVYGASPEHPFEFSSMDDSHIVACVWELEIMYFEKKAWVQHILETAGTPDFDAYLAARFTGEI